MVAKTSNTLLTIAGGALAIGGLILLLISIFGETKDYWALREKQKMKQKFFLKPKVMIRYEVIHSGI